MMRNRSQRDDHKIFDMAQPCHSVILHGHQASDPTNEAGYTLVALIALMTLMALFAMAAAPSILQQAQREREKEAIFRGEEVADAIRIYYNAQLRNGRPAGDTALPTDLDQLVEGVPIAGRTKKLQILRASAARDPLSSTGEWSVVRPHSSEITDFVRDLMTYSGNVRPPTNDPQLKAVELFMAPPVIAISGLTSSPTAFGSGLSAGTTGPFIGVSSSSKADSVIAYYGISRHDQWVFTPLFR
jgi:type II secretory pathway pseudopilin PulG